MALTDRWLLHTLGDVTGLGEQHGARQCDLRGQRLRDLHQPRRLHPQLQRVRDECASCVVGPGFKGTLRERWIREFLAQGGTGLLLGRPKGPRRASLRLSPRRPASISIFISISVSSCCSSCHDKQLNNCLAQNASVVGCTLNKPLSGPCEGWIAEIAFPLAAISLNNSNALPPPEGSYWRINFSRVEWKVRRRKPNASPLHCHVVVKHNNLSRQARDKHMETLKKRGRSPCGAPGPRGRRSLPAGRPSELQLAIAARLRPSKQRRQLGVGGARKSSRVTLSTRQCSPVQFSSVQFIPAAGIALHCCACARQTE